MSNSAKNPCRGCVYFNACGENTRTAPCADRVTKSERKSIARKERLNDIRRGV